MVDSLVQLKFVTHFTFQGGAVHKMRKRDIANGHANRNSDNSLLVRFASGFLAAHDLTNRGVDFRHSAWELGVKTTVRRLAVTAKAIEILGQRNVVDNEFIGFMYASVTLRKE